MSGQQSVVIDCNGPMAGTPLDDFIATLPTRGLHLQRLL
jgi:hypothetical protein